MIVGAAEQEVQQDGRSVRVPFPGARIIATGDGKKYETSSDTSGQYELRVPVGTYEMAAEVPAGQYADAFPTRVETLFPVPPCDTAFRLPRSLAGARSPDRLAAAARDRDAGGCWICGESSEFPGVPIWVMIVP